MQKLVMPVINVTPLIDVLLVMLIIFMVLSPTKPRRFEVRAPEKTTEEVVESLNLVVSLKQDGSYLLNNLEAKTLPDLESLLHKAIDNRPAGRKQIFIKAPRNFAYSKVVKAIDIVKIVGGSPIGLQLDDLD